MEVHKHKLSNGELGFSRTVEKATHPVELTVLMPYRRFLSLQLSIMEYERAITIASLLTHKIWTLQ